MRAQAIRAAIAGVVCLGVLGAMLTRHAWPLWTGQTVYLRVVPVDPRDLFRGEYVRLGYAVDRLCVDPRACTIGEVPVVPAAGDWTVGLYAPDPRHDLRRRQWRDRTLYLALRVNAAVPGTPTATAEPVSLSDRPVAGALNLRGRVRSMQHFPVLDLDYGVDAFFVQEGRARPIEEAIRAGRPVLAELAVASSGLARVRALLVDGRRIE
jgi:uncharacterized membrane-anchored protein